MYVNGLCLQIQLNAQGIEYYTAWFKPKALLIFRPWGQAESVNKYK